MTLSKEVLEREISNSTQAIIAHEEGIEIHKIVLKSFKEAVEQLE